MQDELSGLTGTALEIARVIGRRDALYLIGRAIKWEGEGHYGKAGKIYIPKKPTKRFVELVGSEENAKKLALSELGGSELPITTVTAITKKFRDADIRRQGEEMASRGEKGITKKLAILFDMTEQNIRLILKK
jgi:hypothetical protein